MIYSKKELMELYVSAVGLWGIEKQKVMLIEECAELIQAMSKNLRFENRMPNAEVIDELADVKIMIEQMEMLYQIDDAVEARKQEKLERLDERIKNERGKEP